MTKDEKKSTIKVNQDDYLEIDDDNKITEFIKEPEKENGHVKFKKNKSKQKVKKNLKKRNQNSNILKK